LRKEIAKHTALNEANVLITCTHNHSGPITDKLLGYLGDPAYAEPDMEYLDYLMGNVVASAAKAAATTRDVEIASLSFEIDFQHINVDAILIRDAVTKEFVSAVIIMPVIPEFMGQSTEFSADYPGLLRNFLRKKIGNNINVLCMMSPYKDFTEHVVSYEKIVEETATRIMFFLHSQEIKWTGGEVFFNGTIAEVKMEKAVFPSLWESKMKWAELRHVYEKGSSLNDIEQLKAKKKAMEACSVMKYALAEQSGKINSLLAEYLLQDIQYLVIGDLYLLGMPGVLSNGYAEIIKKKFAQKLYIVTPANGNVQGYMKTEMEINQPVKIVSPLSISSIDAMVEKAVTLLSKKN